MVSCEFNSYCRKLYFLPKHLRHLEANFLQKCQKCQMCVIYEKLDLLIVLNKFTQLFMKLYKKTICKTCFGVVVLSDVFVLQLSVSMMSLHFLGDKLECFFSHNEHPAGTSKDSDKCDLSKDSEIAPLTLGLWTIVFFTVSSEYIPAIRLSVS